MSYNILIAEDDQALQKLVSDMIRKQGYTPIVASNGEEALDLFFTHKIAVCILDIMMPIYNGWEVMESIREYSDVPIMMLTALGDSESEVKGLEKGADEYIAKPFSYPVFIARLENLLKKIQSKRREEIVVGKLSFCDETHEVKVNGVDVELNNKEYLLLEYFLSNQKNALTRDQILLQIWGFDYEGDVRTVDTHIKMLRKKLGECGEYIHTVRGVGYQFKEII
ncbi:MAG: response regulator transcription factor [Eubacteriales bacterium]